MIEPGQQEQLCDCSWRLPSARRRSGNSSYQALKATSCSRSTLAEPFCSTLNCRLYARG